MTRIQTPAFVLDECALQSAIQRVNALKHASGCRILYSVKALALSVLLDRLATELDGFAASSIFEARFASEYVGRGTVHLTTPGAPLPSDVAKYCNFMSVNSIGQWARYFKRAHPTSVGIRVNPQLALDLDDRYNPCRRSSKLGIPISELRSTDLELSGVEGLHVHAACEDVGATTFTAIIAALELGVPELLKKAKWLNLGGGYLFSEAHDLNLFVDAIVRLRTRYDGDVYLEPGHAIAGPSVDLIATVTDLFCRDGVNLAVLDTTVAHVPEVFEYQFTPSVYGSAPGGGHRYQLAGSSCLAGDLFGEYHFAEPLEIGSTITFQEMGAYSLTKAAMFNGINLPNVYLRHQDGSLTLVKEYTYGDYRERWV